MKVLIVEDEKLAAEKLQRQILELYPDFQIVGHTESVSGTLSWLQGNRASLIFMDIHLSDGLCFEIFRQAEVDAPVIFTTAYDQYAIEAFQVNSIDYLLKPVQKKDLEKAVSKLRHFRHLFSNGPLDLDNLIQQIRGEAVQYQKRFMVLDGEAIQSISVEDVAYFLADGKYVFLVSNDGKQFLVDITLEKLVTRLDPEHFFRINRQYILSLNAIEKMVPWTRGRIKIWLKPAAEKEILVSIEKSPRFKEWLNR